MTICLFTHAILTTNTFMSTQNWTRYFKYAYKYFLYGFFKLAKKVKPSTKNREKNGSV